ncbi:MAG: PAS domain S-box protein, partial [Planctomycetota bacterium]
CCPAESEKLWSPVRFTRQKSVDFNGHHWTVSFTQLGGGFFTAEYAAAWLTMAGGIVITVLLSGLVHTLQNTRDEAERMADSLSVDLRRSEAHYRAIVDQAADGIFIMSCEGEIIEVNDAFANMHGYTAKELLATSLAGLDPDSKPLFAARMRWILAGETLTFEVEHLRKDGSRFPLEVSASLVEVGGQKCIMAFHRDITDRKRAEEILRESEQRYRSLVNGIGLGVVQIGADYRIRSVNSAQARLFGKAPADFVGKECFREFEKRDALCPNCPGKLAMETGQPVEIDRQGVRDDGRTHMARVQAFPLSESMGQGVGFIEVAEDITDRLRAEEALRDSEDRFRTLTTLSPVGIYLTDTEGHCDYANPRWCEMAGLSLEEALGEGWIRGLHPEDKAGVFSLWQQMVASEGHWGMEYRFQTPAGKVTWVYGLATARRGASGKIVGYVGVNTDITDRKQVEVALRTSETNLRTLLDTIPDLVWLKDPQGVYLRCNRRFEGLFDAKEGDILGKTDYDFMSREVADAFRQHDRAAVDAGKATQNDEWVTFAEDGHRELLETSKTPIVGSDGRLIGILGIGRDITDRKRAAEALQEANEQRQLLLESISDAFFAMDDQMIVTYYNSAAEHLLGRATQDVLGRALFDAFPEARGSIFETNYRRAIETKQFLAFEVHFVVPPFLNWYDVRVYPTRQGIAVFFQITSERKQAEEALRLSEERFRTLVESITDYTYQVRVRGGRVEQTTHGPGCLGLTGYSPEEFLAAPALWFKMVHPEDQPTVFERAGKLSLGQQAGPLEHRILHKNGAVRWVRNSAVLRHDPDGQYAGYDGLVQDITNFRQLQDQLTQAQKMEAIGRLAGGVAHDFRNQLTVVMGYGQMMLRRKLVKDEGLAMLEAVLQAAERSSTITGQLLAFSRKEILHPSVQSIRDVITDIVKILPHMVGEDIRMMIQLSTDACQANIDAHLFQQAIMNLATNARDAMPKGGTLTIDTACVALGEESRRIDPDLAEGPY